MADEDKKAGDDLEANLSDLEFDRENKSEKTEKSSGAADDKKDSDADESTDALRKMQSERDKAVAERNKLQKQVDAGEEKKSSADDADDGGSRSSDGPDPWVVASKSNYRDQLYDSDPALKASAIDRSLIVGDTPDQMRTSFEGIQSTVRKMRGEITNQVLTEHGLAPVPGAGERREPVNYETMPKEAFEREVEKALQG